MIQRILFLLNSILIIASCSPKDSPSIIPIREENITFSTYPDNSKGIISITSDTLMLMLNITSKMPDSGVKNSIVMIQVDNGQEIMNNDVNTDLASTTFKLFPFQAGKSYSIKVTSISNGSKTNLMSKNLNIDRPIIKPMVYPSSLLDAVSDINKSTSWYKTNKSFSGVFNVNKSLYWGFEKTNNGLIPYNTSTTSSWSQTKSYYWNELGVYLYTDLNGDGKKDLWVNYMKSPWPTNANGLFLFSEYEKQPSVYDLQTGLTQVRKCVLADINNDKNSEIVLFSPGFDSSPFPGDSIGIFYPIQKYYQFLSKDIGYFHGGATGDINNDGLVDIVAYSGGSAVIPVHPTAYINNGKGNFTLSNKIFKGFTGNDNFYTVELFDINQDGKLDLILGTANKLIIIYQDNGEYNRQNAISLPLEESGLMPLDISFFDFNQDGKIDILTMNQISYQGYMLCLYLNDNNNFVNVTGNYIDRSGETGNNAWIAWIHLYDNDGDGDIDIVGDGLYGSLNGTEGRRIWWRNDSGKFIRVNE